MKATGKILFLLVSVFVWKTPVWSQCVPDNTIQAGQGIFPAVLPDATINVAYSQVVQFKSPTDTMVYVPSLQTTVKASIDSMRILDVIGLPPGITYECYNGSCKILGGQVGCALLSGTCTVRGYYPLKIAVKVSGKAKLGALDIPQTVTDTNENYYIMVNWPTSVNETDATTGIRVYPNPAKGVLNIEMNNTANKQEPAVLTIYDLSGRVMMSRPAEGENKYQLDISALSKGIYLTELRSADHLFRSKFSVE